MFAPLSLILLIALLVPVSTRFVIAAQSQPGIPATPELLETKELIFAPDQSQMSTTLQDAPLMFIENVGQFVDGTRFQVRGSDRTMWLAEDAIWVIVFEQEKSQEAEQAGRIASLRPRAPTSEPRRGVHLRLSFVGANSHSRFEPFNLMETHVSYFIGNNPEQWQPRVPVWGGVRYVDLYLGVDLEITGEKGYLVQSLVAHAGADLHAVRLRVEGADALTLEGDVICLSTAVGDFALPLLAIEGYVPHSQSAIFHAAPLAFEVPSPFSHLLVTRASLSSQDNLEDLLYSTFLGGSDFDRGFAVAVDQADNIYATGDTLSLDFPTTTGAFDTSHNGNGDVFVARVDAAARYWPMPLSWGGATGGS